MKPGTRLRMVSCSLHAHCPSVPQLSRRSSTRVCAPSTLVCARPSKRLWSLFAASELRNANRYEDHSCRKGERKGMSRYPRPPKTLSFLYALLVILLSASSSDPVLSQTIKNYDKERGRAILEIVKSDVKKNY